MSSQTDAAPFATFAPLSVPAYRRVWGASVVSSLGTFLHLTAGPWLMLELTGSPLMVSLVTAALTFPRLLLMVPAGVLADAIDRRTLMLIGNLLNAVAAAVLALIVANGTITPALLLGLTFALGVGAAITLPAMQTLVPDLVPAGLRAQAITLNSAAFNVARAVGPSLGGALVAVGLASLAFGLNAASFVLVVGVLLSFSRTVVEDDRGRRLWRAAALGVRYVRFTQPLRVLLATTAVFALTSVSVQALLPNVVSDELGLGAGGFGVLYGLFGAGALAGALSRERVRARAGRGLLPGSIAAYGIGGIAFGLATGPVVAGAGLVVAGAAWVWTLTTLNASIQIIAPRWVRGRVVSLYLLAVGLQPVGAVAAGTLAEGLGAGIAVAVLSGGTLVLGLVAARRELPLLGELTEPVPPDDWSVPPHASYVAGSPVVVATTWQLDPDEIEQFLEVLRELRRVRLRTGALRWSLYRDVDRPNRVTEFFVLPDWDEHLAQHGRLDAAASQVLLRARSFDRAGGPVSRHLAGLDILDPHAPPIAEQLVTVHSELHERDGSVPLR